MLQSVYKRMLFYEESFKGGTQVPDKTAVCLPKEILLFIENVNEIIFLISEDGTIVSASSKAESFWGDDKKSVVGLKIEKMFPKVYVDAIFTHIEKDAVKDTGLTFAIENSKGEKRMFETNFSWLPIAGVSFLSLTCRDIGGYLSLISTLSESEDLYKSLFHEASLGFIHVNSDGLITDCNAAFLNIFNVFRDEVIGVSLAAGDDFGAYPEFTRAAMDALKGVGSRHEKHFVSPRQAAAGWLRVSFSPVRSDNQVFLGAVGIVEDITEQRQIAESVSFISSHDALTGLFNRRSCEDAILGGLGSRDDLPLGILYADLNCLKLANDAFGHAEGDRLLRTAASILKDTGDDEDEVYRWGGDEFVLLLKRTSEDAMRGRMERIQNAACEWEGEGFVRPSLALGGAIKVLESEDVGETLKIAEEAMYKDKLRKEKKISRIILNALEASMYELCEGRLGIRCKGITGAADWAADACGLSKDETLDFSLLCRYHDIGMLSIPEELSVIQRNVSEEISPPILQHPAIGYRIARCIPEVAPIADMILAHHEWWSGEGYPNQLRGEKIPLLSRLISIFDALEGMTTLRPAEFRLSLEEALCAIEASAGKRYDPRLVRIVAEQIRGERLNFAFDQEE